MDPEKLRKWILRVRTDGAWLRLSHRRVEGDITVRQWGAVDVRSDETPDIAAQVLDVAQDYADTCGEACQFTIAWVNLEGQQVAGLVHRAAPFQSSMPDGARADLVTGNAMTATLLRHIEVQQQTLVRALSPILNSYQQAMTMQAGVIEKQAGMIERQGAALQVLVNSIGQQQAAPMTEEEREAQITVQLAQAKALDKLAELGPDVGKLGLLALQRWIFGDNGAGEAGHS